MEKYDGWIAKDKYGDFWFGTLGKEEKDTKLHIKDSKWKDEYRLKVVKVKLVEVK